MERLEETDRNNAKRIGRGNKESRDNTTNFGKNLGKSLPSKFNIKFGQSGITLLLLSLIISAFAEIYNDAILSQKIVSISDIVWSFTAVSEICITTL